MQDVQETRVQSLGQENTLEEGMATQFSILAWKIPWTEESGRLKTLGLQRVGYGWVRVNESIGSRNENQNNYPYFADEKTEALKRQF